MKRNRGVLCFGLILLVTSLLSGCGKSNKNLSEVKIAYFPNITHSQALAQKEDGSLQKAFGNKIKVKWQKFNAGSSEVEAFLAGDVDIGYIGPGPAINGYIKSKGEMQVIAGGADAAAILVSRNGSNIKSVKDLNGKKVAIPQFGNTQDLNLRILLAENGLKDKTKGGTVEIIQAENPDIKTLLDKGSIDAALVPEPWGSRLVKEVGAKVVLDYDEIWKNGKYPTAVVVARKDFIKDHPDIVEKFLKIHVQKTQYIIDNTDKSEDLINKQLKEVTGKDLAKDILNSSFKRIKVTNNPEKGAIIDMADWSLKEGFIKKKSDLKGMFDFDILNKVLKSQGQSEIN
ncbi:aliphatic sulfonate ABC transporter substrate-binding protein [Clostridium neuense]|uniref:Aliphatic sulfonate ABC transporter substrate-binding protein n=1 Tax=Clostridium neuense TaxID=1728934 RepID=A0ABW8TIN2_9CLOT